MDKAPPKVPYLVNAIDMLMQQMVKTSDERKENWDIIDKMVENFPGVSLLIIDPVQLTSELRIKSAVERVILLTPSDRGEHYTVHSDTGAEANFRPAGWSLQTIAKRIAADVLSSVNINKKKTRNTEVSKPAALHTEN